MVASRLARSSSLMAPAYSASESAAPIIEASGERRSCETEDSSAERRRSVSSLTRALSRSATSRVRSTACPMSSTMASARRCCSKPSRPTAPGNLRPTTPTVSPSVRTGRNHQVDWPSVSVKRPAAWPWRRHHDAAARSFSAQVAIQRLVERIGRPEAEAHVGPQHRLQDLARRGLHLPAIGRSRQLAPQRLHRGGVRVGCAQRQHLAAQAGCQAPGHQRGHQEDGHRGDPGKGADVEGVAWLDEEEVVAQEAQHGRGDAGADAGAGGHQQHRDDEHHRQVGEAEKALAERRHTHRRGAGHQHQQRLAAAQGGAPLLQAGRAGALAFGVLTIVSS